MMKVSESENYVDSIDSAVSGEIHTYMYVDDNRNNYCQFTHVSFLHWPKCSKI